MFLIFFLISKAGGTLCSCSTNVKTRFPHQHGIRSLGCGTLPVSYKDYLFYFIFVAEVFSPHLKFHKKFYFKLYFYLYVGRK